MIQPERHILAADIGGTHIGIAIFATYASGKLEPVRHETYPSKKTKSLPRLLAKFLKQHAFALVPKITRACIDFAGPVGPDRSKAFVTNLGWGFTAEEIQDETGIEELTLVNDFEAVGYGFEVLLANRPESFIRISPKGKLPNTKGKKPTAVVLGAGTGLGTSILIHDSASGKYRPIAGEGGHADFVAVDEIEYRISQWIRTHLNQSPRNPMDCEKIVSGPGLANVFLALSNLEPAQASGATERILKLDPRDRPAAVVENAQTDALCRKTLDIWLRCYARVAKNSATFPLAPGGVFLAGGIAAKILPEIQSGVFMKEFTRCDIPNIRSILQRTPVFVITDYRIGLYGCANVAVNFFADLG
jgi:glucokinase